MSVADLLLSQAASRYFIQKYFSLTFIILGLASLALFQVATRDFRTACFYGMAVPIVSSFISFLITEWAFEQPTAIFLGVAVGSLVIRMFNLLLAFVVGLVILDMHAIGLLVGLLGTYLAYLVIEISYIHNKGLLLGQ